MCGRAYVTYSDDELYFQYLNRRAITTLEVAPIYNLCPTQDALVLRQIHGGFQFEPMRWQLVPQWEPAFKTKLSTINARCEGIFASELYRNLVIRQRCVIPLSGFYEWKRAPSRNRPYKVYRHDGEIMSVGGVWDVWHPGRPDEHHSFSIITTPANNRIGTIHNRMPLILDRAGVEEWVDPEVQERDPLQRLMKPCPDSWLETVEVSTLVNSPKNNSPEVLAPLQAPLSQER